MTFVLSLVLLVHATTVGAERAMDLEDRIRIAEARRIAERYGDTLWPGYLEAPFAVLLVTREAEFLVHHSEPTEDFVHLGYDTLLESDVYCRDRVFEVNLLASFPAVSGVPTIVIGQPHNTDASHSTRWVTTLLHEHFHQWQQSWPDYYAAVDSLGLAGKDSTGMWMLNYPFPYDSLPVRGAFEEMCRRLWEALDGIDAADFRTRVDAYLTAKAVFKDVLAEDDYAYFSFQVWQEGLARYTEYKLARLAGDTYTPTELFTSLHDYVPFDDDAGRIRDHIATELLRVSLKKSKRSAFYHVGGAEGILLDRINPGWRQYYLTRKFCTDTYFR
ncbi:MAG: hypothetical protein JSW50_08380 [Candidatus Latescibacterota bacterium]|nr:MAG: hypothetical protein JSW50_08380 [Candidatus Latescibacterota bacterium]